MFVFRGLFWLVLVALLIPRGPDLGIDVRHAMELYPVERQLQGKTADLFNQMRGLGAVADAVVENYRRIAIHRLALVRVQIAVDRARRGKAAELSAIIPAEWRD